MQDQDRVGISDAMSSELYSKLMLSGNQRPDIRDSSSGPDISYGSSSLVLQQHVRTGSAPPQLDNMSGSPFFAEGGTKGAFFGNAPTGASQMGYDTAGFRSNVSDDRKHAGTVDTAKLLHHKMKPMDARGMPMSASGGDVRSQLWLNKAAAEGKTWAQQDTDDRDVPLAAGTSQAGYMLHAGLQPSMGSEGIAGSCPAPSSHLDAELPYFSGKSIRTHPNLASLQAVSRAGSAYGGPSSATSMLAAETPFTQGDGLFHASSPLTTPRSPLFDMNATAMAGSNGMLDVQGTSNMPAKDILCGMGDVLQGRSDNRYKPSKLRNMSSEYDNPVSTAALLAAGASSMMVVPPAMDTFGLAAEASGQTSTSSTGLLEAAAMAQQQQQQQEQQQQAAMASFAAAAAAAAGMYPGGGMPGAGMPGVQPMMGMAGAPLPAMPGAPPGLPLPADPTGAVNPYTAMQMAWWQAMTNLMPHMFMGFGGYPPYGPMPGADPTAMPGMPPGLPPGLPPFSNPAEYAACMQRMLAAAASHGPWGNPAGFMAMAAAAAASAGAGGGAGGPGSHLDERDVMGGGLRGGDRRRTDRMGGRRCEDPCSLLRPNRLLEQFKETKDSSHWAMRDVLGHMLDFSLDQHGSRFIQQHLGELTQAELSIAFHELLPKALTLMNDVFGNYVIQKVLELGPAGHRSELMLQMRGQVLHLSLQMYSCRVIQKALEVVSLKEKVEMVGELEGHVLRCVRDQNGNHVVQKIIECVPTRHIGHLLDAVIGQLVPLAVHSFGCRVVQRILEHCDDPSRHEVVMREILGATVQLTQDQYGNYVIQHVLEHGTNAERTAIISQLAPHIVALSQNKFASNVVEKCLLHGSPQQRVALVEGILNSPGPRGPPGPPGAGPSSSSSSASGEGSGPEGEGSVDAAAAAQAAEDAEADPLYKMMKDQFGNYVVQKVLEVCNDDQRERLLARVRAQLWSLKKYTYGKHIVTRVEKLLSAGTRIQTGQQRYSAMNVGVVITPESSSTSIGMPAANWQPAGPSPPPQQQQQQSQADGSSPAVDGAVQPGTDGCLSGSA